MSGPINLKRKSPYGSMSSSPAPRVKAEAGDVKRMRGLGGTPSASHFGFSDPRTVVLELREYLKERGTMPWIDAEIHVGDKSPGVDPHVVLELLKKQERVKYNETNQVFTYEPEIVLRTQADLRSHIRSHTQPTSGLTYKALRELFPGPELATYMENLESDGSILILRSLTGQLKNAPLPELGRQNAWGEKLNAGGPERWRTVWWDEIRERGRAADRVDDEFIYGWADVRIADTDNIAKLLEDQDLKASSAPPPPPRTREDNKPKKKKNNRRLKITNQHMKSLGFDFSQDFEAA